MKTSLGQFGLALMVLTACVPESSRDTARPDTSSTQLPAEEPAETRDPWRISPDGVDDVRIGMTFSELAPYLGNPADTAKIGDSCGYVGVAGAPEGVRFMVEGRRLVRVEVINGSARTPEGIRIGDSEQRILELHPDARRLPHKYTDGHYLIALPDAPSDTLHRYVFETDGSRVTRYRAGVYPQVEYVEGCS